MNINLTFFQYNSMVLSFKSIKIQYTCPDVNDFKEILTLSLALATTGCDFHKVMCDECFTLDVNLV